MVSETLTVGELCRSVKVAVAETFPDEIWVKGAISDLTRSQNGHVYFNLIDPSDDVGTATENVVPVALFSSSRHRVNAILRRTGKVRMHDGVEIRIRGEVAYYPPQGRIQLVMSLIDPAYTVGQMTMARQILLDRLAAEGLLDANGRIALPSAPLRVGLVTSDGSAAHADFIHELAVSGYRFDVVLIDSRVQGLDAVPSLVDGIERAARSEVDVIVVVRGGGAKTDLVAFDHERVARAIAACDRPVIVGVGHEVDRSVADEVAHTSAKTPTAAAGVLVAAVEAFDADVEHASARLLTLATNRLGFATADLADAGRRLVVAATTATSTHDAALIARASRIRHLADRSLERADTSVERHADRLDALDPARVLARGWSITHTEGGSLVRSPADARAGSKIVTTTAGGRIASTVDETAGDTGGSTSEGAKPARSGDTVSDD